MNYCEKRVHPKASFDKRSFRWVTSPWGGSRGEVRLLVGCPRGQWQPKAERCAVGTRAYKVLSRPGARSCPKGSKRISK